MFLISNSHYTYCRMVHFKSVTKHTRTSIRRIPTLPTARSALRFWLQIWFGRTEFYLPSPTRLNWSGTGVECERALAGRVGSMDQVGAKERLRRTSSFRGTGTKGPSSQNEWQRPSLDAYLLACSLDYGPILWYQVIQVREDMTHLIWSLWPDFQVCFTEYC